MIRQQHVIELTNVGVNLPLEAVADLAVPSARVIYDRCMVFCFVKSKPYFESYNCTSCFPRVLVNGGGTGAV